MLTQTLSVVIPVYRSGAALTATVRELLEVAPALGVDERVGLGLEEVVLVCDNPALTQAERTSLRDLEDLDPRVQTVWLARNFGQHPATAAGIVSTNGDWVATMDEDGQHDPTQISRMLLAAGSHVRPLVYAQPTNPPPHGAARNAGSRLAKTLFRAMSGSKGAFHSFRLMEGSIARSACAYLGDNVYLDVAMVWSCGDGIQCPMPMRAEGAASSYRTRTLLSHFWRMVLSTGTRPLRLVAAGGVLVSLIGLLVAIVVAQRRLVGDFTAPGWTSVMVGMLILAGGVFVTLATLAEYVGFAARSAMGKPLYVKAEHVDSRVLYHLEAALRTEPDRSP